MARVQFLLYPWFIILFIFLSVTRPKIFLLWPIYNFKLDDITKLFSARLQMTQLMMLKHSCTENVINILFYSWKKQLNLIVKRKLLSIAILSYHLYIFHAHTYREESQTIMS